MKKNKNLTSLDVHIEEEYGKIGSKSKDEFEAEYEAFKLDIMLQEK